MSNRRQSSQLPLPMHLEHKQYLQLPQVRLLTVPEVEEALKWLASPTASPPPDSLVHLSQLEWFLLRQFLLNLQADKDNSPLQ